jgi:hypothetical protein
MALAALAAVALYPVLARSRLLVVLASVGGVSLLAFAAALVFRSPALAAWGLAASGTEYGLFLGFRGGTVDRWAPLVAAAVFLAAELGYRALEPPEPVPERTVVLRGVAWLLGGVLGTTLVGSVLLAASGGGTAGLGLEALGASAAVTALGLVVAVVWRAAR